MLSHVKLRWPLIEVPTFRKIFFGKSRPPWFFLDQVFLLRIFSNLQSLGRISLSDSHDTPGKPRRDGSTITVSLDSHQQLENPTTYSAIIHCLAINHRYIFECAWCDRIIRAEKQPRCCITFFLGRIGVAICHPIPQDPRSFLRRSRGPSLSTTYESIIMPNCSPQKL